MKAQLHNNTPLDYYPFGMLMPGRSYSSIAYKYGFNGKEKDNEVKGIGNSLDFGARIYDSRIGRFGNTDKLKEKYPDISPYSFVNNSPMKNIEIDGNYWLDVHTCKTGSCPIGGKGHNGYNKIISAKIYITNANDLKSLNILSAVPFAPEVSWTATGYKFTTACKDNSVNFGLTDWFGAILNITGAGFAKAAKGTRDAQLISVLLDLNRSIPSLTQEQFQSFKSTDYYNIALDKGAVLKLEKEGYGTIDNEGNFNFSKETLDKWHNEKSKEVDANPQKYGVTGKFGSINKEYAVQTAIQSDIDMLMTQKKTEVANEIENKIVKKE